MQNYQFDQWGAAAANAIVLLGEYFVHEELGLQCVFFSFLTSSSSPPPVTRLSFAIHLLFSW